MSTIIPLSKTTCNHVSSDMSESDVARRNDEEDGKLVKEKGKSDIVEFVDFILKSNDKEAIATIKHHLSDFSRSKGHIYDSQLEKIDEWQSRDKLRYEELYDAITKVAKEPKFVILRDFLDIHDNKIDN